jgi:hypothetical protein
MTTARHEAHAATMVVHRAIAMIADRLATVMNALVVSIVIHALLVVVMTGLVVSIEILVRRGIGMIVLAVLIVTLVHLVMVATDHVVSIEILVLHVMAAIDHVVSTEIHVLHVSIEILVHRVTVMIVLVALTVMTVLVVLIAMTVHHALQRKIVQMKCVAALVNVVHPEKCHHHLSVHAKSGLTKVQFVQSVNQMWVAFAQRAQVVRKRADVKKCVLSTPLWNSLSVH